MIETPIEKLAKEKIDFRDYFNREIAGCKEGVHKLGKATICPFHDDTDPSFHIWEKINGFRCFGCGATGDVIRAHQLYNQMYNNRQLTRKQSAQELLTLYAIDYSFIEQSAEEDMSIFELYRRELASNETFKFKKTVMTLDTFKDQNNEIMELDDIDERIEFFNKLDRRAALIASDSVINN